MEAERQDAASDASMPPDAPSGQVSYRRNGKLFSCEPCRKGKLRCDHATPTCGRCARRKKPEQCIYHPAPLTKPRDSPSTESGAQRVSKSPVATRVTPYPPVSQQRGGLISPPISNPAHKEFSAFRPTNNNPTRPASIAQSPSLATLPTPGTTTTTTTSSSLSHTVSENSMSFKTGFLGPTAYNSVYTENPGSLSVFEPDDAANNSASVPATPLEKVRVGAEVLSLLQDMPRLRRLTQRLFDVCDGIIVMEHVFNAWIDELWSEWSHVLIEGKPDRMLALSELVWRNTQTPLKVHGQMSAAEWAKSASGKNLRWEVVGTILSVVGIVAAGLSGWDTIFDDFQEGIVDRATFATRMRKASAHCSCFCYESETLNDVYVVFMFEDLILTEFLKGDTHYEAWQRTGELCDTIVAMGFHQGNPFNADTPFFLTQLRRRLFMSTYGHDKIMASFLGRPPRLSYRYCKMEMCLDLSDDQVIQEGPALDAELATLDAAGWNTQGELKRTTWSRVWFQECRLREEILEVALGSNLPAADIESRTSEIWHRSEALHASFPDFMKISPEEVLRAGESGHIVPDAKILNPKVRQIYALLTIWIHAGIMHTEFQLQRALVNRLKRDTKQLIPISRRMLKIALLAQSRRDFFRDFQCDIVGMLAEHGLPSAGVLAVELLKQEQSRQYASEILPRSETIQDLSVFISALAAVGPGEGNFAICNQGRRALKRVLDQILSPSVPPPAGQEAEVVQFDESFFMPTGNDADFLQWLENVEWDKGLFNVGPIDGV